MLSSPTSEIPLAVYDALVVVTDWLRDTAQDGPRDALMEMRIEGHGEPVTVGCHLTRPRPTEENDPPKAMLGFPEEWLLTPLPPTEEGEADPERQLLSVKVHITDTEALSEPTPERMRSYLEDQGWECCTEKGRKREWWQLPAPGGTYEVLLPRSKTYLDYPRTVSEFLRTVSIAENRSELALWHDLVSS